MGQTNDKVKKVGSRRTSSEQAARFDSSRFVQYELDELQQKACKGWVVTGDDLWGSVLGLVDDGYSVSLKFDSFSDSYACFVQVRGQPDHVNAGLILTGRGSSPVKALKQALFKMDAIGPSWVQYGERRKTVLDD